MLPKSKTLFLIDGSHYDRLRSVLETPFDLGKLATMVNGGIPADQKVYYRDLRDSNEAERQRSLLGWLGHNGFVVKGRTHSAGGPRERYGTNLVEIAIDALLMAEPGDHVMILASDAKLEPLLSALRDYEIKTTLISTREAVNTIAPTNQLIEAAGNFIDLRPIIAQLSLDNPSADRSDQVR